MAIQTKVSENIDWWQKESEKKIGDKKKVKVKRKLGKTKVGSHRGRWEKLPKPRLLSPMDIFPAKDYISKQN